MNFKNIIRLLFCLLCLLIASAGYPAIPSEKTLNKAFRYIRKIHKEPDLKSITISSLNPDHSLHDTVFAINNNSGDLKGYLVVSSAMGRFDLFDFMLIYDVHLEIQDLRILVYRSEHGSEVASRGWLRQFLKQPSNTMFVYGKNIEALSGATFSAKSFTSEINRITLLLSTILE